LLKIKGPFLERIDIVSEVRSITSDDMASIYIDKESCESPEYRKTVEECWNIAHERYGADYLN
jgi:magnesium chelatase family protein